MSPLFVPAGASIGGPVTGGTDTRVLFVQPGGILAQSASLTFDGGTNRLTAGAITSSGDVRADVGAAGTPSFTFSADPDTGLFQKAANVLGIATAGAERGSWDVNGCTAVAAFLAGAGAAGTPSLSFSGDTNTGWFSGGADILSCTTAGVQRWQVSAAGNLLAFADNTYDIGAAAATRPKDVHVAGEFKATGVGLGLKLQNSHGIDGNGVNLNITAGNGVADTMINARGRLAAGTATAASADVKCGSVNTRTAGFIFHVHNNGARKLTIGFDGRAYVGVPNSAPTDADLQVSEVSPYVDQAGNLLLFRVKYSDGTLKLGTVALV